MSAENVDQTQEAQATPFFAEPQEEHQWLQKLVGNWRYESEMAEPGEEPVKVTGTERVHTLGGLWFVAEGEGPMAGGSTSNTMLTVGFDPQRRRFVGSWVGSMMASQFVYDGELDSEKRSLTLYSEGPNMSDPSKTATYRDVIEFLSDDHRTLTGQLQNDDGTWTSLVTTHYYRT